MRRATSRKAAESGFSGPAFIFSIRDIDGADRDDEQDNFGALLTSDWQPKVAGACWQGSPPPCGPPSYPRSGRLRNRSSLEEQWQGVR
jgi:hypothetical protein